MLYDGTRYDNHHYEKSYFVRLYSGFVKAVITHWWPHVLARRVWTLAKLTSLFDAHESPIRLVQRMGRTGRKRDGRIVILVTEGKEEQVLSSNYFFLLCNYS